MSEVNWSRYARDILLTLDPSDDEDTIPPRTDPQFRSWRHGNIVHELNLAKEAMARSFLTAGDDQSVIVASLRRIARHAASMLHEDGEWSVDDMTDLLTYKQSCYGPGNILAFGMVGIVVRMSDKVARLGNLAKNPTTDVRDESAIDTMRDMVGYYVVARMLVDGTFESPVRVNPTPIKSTLESVLA